MCGIAGFIHRNSSQVESSLNRMLSSIEHRGPDDFGCWVEDNIGLALGHRRLSILDLSPAGHQPMVSACGRYTIVFNGEIYNWAELKSELDASQLMSVWRGSSDTEVLLAAIAAWGLVETLKRARGMFALALWDRQESRLFLARDRIGEKPLYYGRGHGGVFFASELKALHAAPGWRGETDPQSLSLFLRYGYVPSPRSIYRDVYKLMPGMYLAIEADGKFGDPVRWWSLSDSTVQAETNTSSPIEDVAALDTLDYVLGNAVEEQMVADVPLGALLSGGIDSSLIVALMQSRSSRPVKTFSIGFSESEYDEAVHARRVANHLGTEHTELYVSPDSALDVIPRLPDIYDEPFGDSSQIPTALVSALTREHVTVCLTGDAGDELFGGYNRYFWATSLWKYFGSSPVLLRKFASKAIGLVSASSWNNLVGLFEPLVPNKLMVSNPGDKLHKLAEILGASSKAGLYNLLVSQWRGTLPLINPEEPLTLINDASAWPELSCFTDQMMALDTLTYLPDDILVKVDRASMAASLETRIPFLDPRVIDFAWSLQANQKVRDGQGKWLLRNLLYRYVPKDMIERPKQGFGVPIDHWLRGPLRDWAEDLLSPSSLSEEGLLNVEPIRHLWEMHLGGRNVQYALWNVLMYQAWRRKWG